ncbi:hypothetical protein GQ44DRAFT_791421 [Phaeosphaeriaceae sp. PMI808]|nr:hypothetical protein GQ44DRAFT_791421 [Phaeosphaeriaceae sp. PMI808]
MLHYKILQKKSNASSRHVKRSTNTRALEPPTTTPFGIFTACLGPVLQSFRSMSKPSDHELHNESAVDSITSTRTSGHHDGQSMPTKRNPSEQEVLSSVQARSRRVCLQSVQDKARSERLVQTPRRSVHHREDRRPQDVIAAGILPSSMILCSVLTIQYWVPVAVTEDRDQPTAIIVPGRQLQAASVHPKELVEVPNPTLQELRGKTAQAWDRYQVKSVARAASGQAHFRHDEAQPQPNDSMSLDLSHFRSHLSIGTPIVSLSSVPRADLLRAAIPLHPTWVRVEFSFPEPYMFHIQSCRPNMRTADMQISLANDSATTLVPVDSVNALPDETTEIREGTYPDTVDTYKQQGRSFYSRGAYIVLSNSKL